MIGCGGGGSGGGGGPVPSTTVLTSSNLNAAFGSTVTFSVRVTANTTPIGTVQLVDNGQLYSSGPVSAGVATFQTTTLPVGTHILTAQYLGDAHTLPSNSAPITQVITGGQVPSTTSLTSSNLHCAYGTTVTFSVQISGSSSPGGTVDLLDNGQVYTTGPVSAGVATFQSASLPVGVHVVTAQYLGDPNTQASNSAPISQVITGSVTFAVTGSSGSTTHNANLTVQVN